MPDENWQKVREIVDSALRRPIAERRSFVAGVCGNNADLLGEINSLLVSLDSAEDFLETPAIEKVADEFLGSGNFKKDQFLRHYKIIRELGSGGMGDVYLATDTKLNRPVALKILRPDLLSDNQSNGRLLREAQAAAKLDHPHICAIHEISETADGSFIVMQYVEGETLADVLTKRPGVDKLLDLAIQIVDALTEAHSHHIIHRDIKPANIIVNEKGQAKVLDFGLAKFVEPGSNSETAKTANSSGALMGTVPYMSPEQLRGNRLDARTDIFSFGAMFYEMLSGEQTFARDSNAETIAAILNDEPDWSRIPSKLRPILQKSLMKNRDLRFNTAEDLGKDLRSVQRSDRFDELPRSTSVVTSPNPQDISNEPTIPGSRKFHFWQSEDDKASATARWKTRNGQTSGSPRVRFNPLILGLVIAVVAILGASALFYRQFRKADDSSSFDLLRPVRLVSWKAASGPFYTDYRVSNGGKLIAYSSSEASGAENIYLKQTADGEELRVTKDEWQNVSPVWSPDDQRIAYSSLRDDKSGIYVSPALGGTSTPLKIIGKGNIFLRHWSKEDKIFYEYQGNLFRFDVSTNETQQITDFPAEPGVEKYFSVSPDETQIAFCLETGGRSDVWVMPVAGGEQRRLTNDGSEKRRPRWHPDGRRIFYNVQRDSFQQISVAYLDGREPVQVTRGDSQYEMIDLSADGTKMYYFAVENRSDISGVRIEGGQEFEVATGIEYEHWADVSPDGKSIVYQSVIAPQFPQKKIIVKPLDKEAPALNVEGYNPHWLPDSRHIWFTRASEEEKKHYPWLMDTVTGEAKQISANGVYPPSHSILPRNRGEIGNLNWSPDGKRFVYLDSKKQTVTLASLEAREENIIARSESPALRYFSPLFSSDGKQIIYLSTEQSPKSSLTKIWLWESGRAKEVYSTAASLRLLGWSASGHELLLRMTDGVMTTLPMDIKLLGVSVAAGNPHVITTFRNVYPTSMSLSRDAKSIAFTIRQNDKDDIWIASTAGGEPKKITANVNTRLYYGSLAWAPDGGTIFFDKQEQIDTISMFENVR